MSDWPSTYSCADLSGLARGPIRLRPIHWDDREPIRRWRNAQLDVLRQADPLTVEDQDRYFDDVVRDQLDQERPDQVLLAMLEDDRLVGYGGVVHISWHNRRGEISFMTEPSRLDEPTLRADWLTFLSLIGETARDRLGLHRLTTETYAIRRSLLEILDEAGFQREGVLRDHAVVDGAFVDSIVHGRLLDDSRGPRVMSIS